MHHLRRILLVPLVMFTLLGTALAHEVGLSANVRAQTSSGETATYPASNVPAGVRVMAIEVIAVYSTGEPMSGAQVRIFAPGDPSTPWRTGTLNQQGRYTFTPDLSRRGRWTVRVEQTGHSSFINVAI
jgi:nickel transport protein